jgi:hypothetical protein
VRHWPLAALLAVVAANWVLWASAVPFGEAPDEPSHLEIARFVAEHGRLPLFGPAADFYVRLDQVGIPIESHALAPPLTYLVDAALLRLLPGSPVGVARLGSLLAALVAVALAYALVWRLLPAQRPCALPVAALLAAVPQFSFQAAVVNSDVYALAAALAVGSLWPGVRRPLGAVAFGVALGLALLAKYTVYPVAALAAGAACWHAWEACRSARRVLARLAVVGLAALLVAGPWLLHNWQRYGAVLPLAVAEAGFRALEPTAPIPGAAGFPHPLDPAYLRAWVAITFRSFWAGFGRVDVFAPAWCYAAILGVLGVAALGWVRAAATPGGRARLGASLRRPTGALLVAWPVATLLAAVVTSFSRFFLVHGRYLVALLPIVALGMVLGWRAAAPARWQRVAVWAPIVVMGALNVYCLLGVVVPHYYGPGATRVAVTVDSPRPGDVAGEPTLIRGWAVVAGRAAWEPGRIGGAPAWHAPATVRVTVDGQGDAALVGGSGVARPDVARALAAPAAASAGVEYRWEPRGAPPGAHVVQVCAADPAAQNAPCVPIPVRVPAR